MTVFPLPALEALEALPWGGAGQASQTMRRACPCPRYCVHPALPSSGTTSTCLSKPGLSGSSRQYSMYELHVSVVLHTTSLGHHPWVMSPND